MFRRYVALGDSSTEGLDDPDGDGGYRGWADRLAARLAAVDPEVRYANLAVRGMSAAEIEAAQLAPAVAMRPDLATVVVGMNDLLRGNFDAARVASHVVTMGRALRAAGAVVVTFTIPDASGRMGLGTLLSARTETYNLELRRAAAQVGAVLLDLDGFPLAHDARMWSDDRLHGTSEGHARIAEELAHMLGVPGARPGALDELLPPAPPRAASERVVADLAWIARHVAPWAWRRLRGRTAGHGRVAKRPELAPLR
jgi:lysophospholipase L1-like esterase